MTEPEVLHERIHRLEEVISSCCQCRFENGKLVAECHYHKCERYVRMDNGDPSDLTLLELIARLTQELLDTRKIAVGLADRIAAQSDLLSKKAEKPDPSTICCGHGDNATGPPCCDKAGQYNGYQSGPTLFTCPKHCGCHD